MTTQIRISIYDPSTPDRGPYYCQVVSDRIVSDPPGIVTASQRATCIAELAQLVKHRIVLEQV